MDLMERAAATTPAAGQVGAILILAAGHVVELGALRTVLDARIGRAPRLRQQLTSTPPGCGRPIWTDDPAFDIGLHVGEVPCPPPGDRSAVLAVAADLLTHPLPPDRPLWAATLVTALTDGSSALVLRFHHVMADGMGGLAVLAGLVDGSPAPPEDDAFPRPAPSTRALFADTLRTRGQALTGFGAGRRRVRDAVAELSGRPPRAPRCSLNERVGAGRSIDVASVPLAAFHTAARVHGASVNDAALVAITGATSRFLHERDEAVDHLVVSMPVSTRSTASAGSLGNQIGVVAVSLPVCGTISERLAATAAITHDRGTGPRGASAPMLAPAFRLLGALGVLRWVTDRQRMVTTFVTNLRGPVDRVELRGAPVEQLIPLNSTSGNVQVAFGVFSYAGTLTVTLMADAGMADDLPRLVALLDDELAAIVRSAPAPHASGGTS